MGHFTGQLLLHICVMNEHELSMQICDVQRWAYQIWLILAFVFLTFIPRTLVALVFPEGFIMEVKLFSLEVLVSLTKL